jgi:hypothetical protein
VLRRVAIVPKLRSLRIKSIYWMTLPIGLNSPAHVAE